MPRIKRPTRPKDSIFQDEQALKQKLSDDHSLARILSSTKRRGNFRQHPVPQLVSHISLQNINNCCGNHQVTAPYLIFTNTLDSYKAIKKEVPGLKSLSAFFRWPSKGATQKLGLLVDVDHHEGYWDYTAVRIIKNCDILEGALGQSVTYWNYKAQVLESSGHQHTPSAVQELVDYYQKSGRRISGVYRLTMDRSRAEVNAITALEVWVENGKSHGSQHYIFDYLP